MSELDLFDELANSEDIPQEPMFEDLPPKAWCLGRTATADQGGAAPTTRKNEGKDGKPDWYKFNVGLSTLGGDRLITAAHANKMCFFGVGIDPWENDSGPVSGKLAGFMNAVLATGVASDVKDPKARSKARWAASMVKLKEFAGTNPMIEGGAVVLSSYQGDKARYLVGLLTAYLLENPQEVLFKTVQSVNKKTGQDYGIQVGATEEATEANIAKRKVQRLEGAEGGVTF
jgi:hypothetical protein